MLRASKRPGSRASRACVVAAAATMGIGSAACTQDEGPVEPRAPTVPARRAAESFVHCVEQEGGLCVVGDEGQRAWNAFTFLGWLGSGSPLAILQALPREVGNHANPKSVQARFVQTATLLREPVRGAECTPKDIVAMDKLLPLLRQKAEKRMNTLGLWRTDVQKVVTDLEAEAREGLTGGYLVHMTCHGDPYNLYVATKAGSDRQVVVGILTTLPVYLGGESLTSEAIEGRFGGRTIGGTLDVGVIAEGTVDSRWIPIPVEDF